MGRPRTPHFVVRFGAIVTAGLVALETTADAQARPAPSTLAVTPPTLVDGPPPAYPDGAEGSARVVVELVVGTDGRVETCTALDGGPPKGRPRSPWVS